MDRQILEITANEQMLTLDNPIRISTNKVSYIEARFDLGQNWSGYDSVRAVWFNDYQTISTVLDANGHCLVPFEVMKRKGKVKVNLVGSISDGDVLTDRLTSYPIVAVVVDCVAPITGAETSPITPSQFEQFVSIVHDEVEEVTGMSAEATTLPAGSEATASYSGGVMSFGIPRGDTGTTGATPDFSIGTVETLEPNEPATATITGTTDNPVLNLGIPKGAQGDVNMTQLESVLPTDTASGSIASFPDGTSLFPAKAVKVSLEPIQDTSSGDPSPDNICPIYGRTGCEVDVTGKNLLDVTQYPFTANTWINGNSGAKVPNASGWSATVDFVPCKHLAGQTVTLNHRPNGYTPGVAFYTEQSEASFVSGIRNNSGTEGTAWTFQIPSDAVYMRITVPPSYVDSIQLELGSTATDYTPYVNGTTYTVTWQTEAGTVYGGTVDVVSGELNVTMGYIASYNGETIGEPWISDRDEYVAGTTPSIGAEVAYTLVTPQTYQLTPTEISLYDGTNNVWSDGEVEVVYKADIEKYIEKKLG